MNSRRCAGCTVSSLHSRARLVPPAREADWNDGDLCAVGLTEERWYCPACLAPSNELEAEPAKSVSHHPVPSVPRHRNQLRVLLIDDEDLVRRCTARCLTDFELVTARSGAEALEILRQDADFDAVLSDVMMPQMTGPDLFERCCQQYPHLAQRFVFASGDRERAGQLLQRALARVGDDYQPRLLGKPSTREELELALFAAAARSAHRSGTWLIARPVHQVKKYRG